MRRRSKSSAEPPAARPSGSKKRAAAAAPSSVSSAFTTVLWAFGAAGATSALAPAAARGPSSRCDLRAGRGEAGRAPLGERPPLGGGWPAAERGRSWVIGEAAAGPPRSADGDAEDLWGGSGAEAARAGQQLPSQTLAASASPHRRPSRSDHCYLCGRWVNYVAVGANPSKLARPRISDAVP